MSKLLSYLRSLCNATVAKAVHSYTPVYAGSVNHSATVEQWADVIAPFDGWVQIRVETAIGIAGINMQSVGGILATNLPTLNNTWGAACLPIKKGEGIRILLNGSGAGQTFTLFPSESTT